MYLPRFLSGRTLQRLAVFAAVVTMAAPAFGQSGKPADVIAGGSCAGIMEQLNEARAATPGRYTKAQMLADDRCLGVMERIDKARMITRDEYAKAYKRQPDCSASAYSYLCE